MSEPLPAKAVAAVLRELADALEEDSHDGYSVLGSASIRSLADEIKATNWEKR